MRRNTWWHCDNFPTRGEEKNVEGRTPFKKPEMTISISDRSKISRRDLFGSIFKERNASALCCLSLPHNFDLRDLFFFLVLLIQVLLQLTNKQQTNWQINDNHVFSTTCEQ